MRLTISLTTSSIPEPSSVGAKATSLIRLKQAGFSVPDGFVLTAAFFAPWVDELKTSSAWRSVCARLGSPGSGGLREACAAAKRRAVELSMSAVQRIQLDEVSAALGNRQLAVRSSSPEEDLSGASFAGLYRTCLNIGPDTLEQAVRACFQACLDERVLLYKRQQGLQVEAPSFAVIVQAQIMSDVSGVAFSINPLTNDFDQAVINAARGQGKAVVAGDITPDRFVVDKVTGAMLERQAGSKGGEGSDRLCLSDAQASVLTETLKAVEALYAVPVDVEWGYADGRFHLLQARPVTAYVPLPPGMLTAPGAPRLLYLDAALSKGLTSNSAITPMTLDLLLRLMRLAAAVLLGKKDISPDPKRDLFGPAGARLYLNLSNVLHLTSRERLIRRARLTDAMIADILETQDLEAYRPPRPPSSLRVLPLVRTLVRVGWGLRGLLGGMLVAVFRRRTFLRRYRAEVASFERAIAEPADFKLPIDAFLRHYYAKLATVVSRATAPALVLFLFFGTQRLDRLIDRDSETRRALVDAIKRGYSGDLVVEMGAMMYELATLLPAAAYADIDSLVSRLERRDLPEAFLSLWDEFIHRFGCRGPLEMEIANPRYGDDTAIALRQIATIARSGGAFDPRKIQRQHVREREVAYTELRAQLPGHKRRVLDRCYRNIVDFGGARDTPKYHIVMINQRIRRRVLAEADVLIAAGRLDRAAQIFELTFADLEQAARDPALDLRVRVRERGRFYRQVKRNVKHFPQMIDSRGRIIRPLKPTVAGELSGIAISPGVVRGPVKVLDDPFEKEVMPGDVLVAYTTDPGWTPLFINTGAVVLEVGGELQHGALVAREYGKPCVAGIDQVTTRLHDGDLVEVNGDAGVVRMIGPVDKSVRLNLN